MLKVAIIENKGTCCTPCFFMPRINGIPLTRENLMHIPMQERFYIAQECVKVFMIFSQQGIIHNDIKPNNFLYDQRTRTVTLLDHGAASYTAGISYKHTTSYAAPEKRLCQYGSALSDIFSLGLTVAEILDLTVECGNKQPLQVDLTRLNNKEYQEIPTKEKRKMARVIKQMTAEDYHQRSIGFQMQ